MVFKIIDLENDLVYFYSDRSFCPLIKVDERNFNNRWKRRTTTGLTFRNRFYVCEVELKIYSKKND